MPGLKTCSHVSKIQVCLFSLPRVSYLLQQAWILDPTGQHLTQFRVVPGPPENCCQINVERISHPIHHELQRDQMDFSFHCFSLSQSASEKANILELHCRVCPSQSTPELIMKKLLAVYPGTGESVPNWTLEWTTCWSNWRVWMNKKRLIVCLFHLVYHVQLNKKRQHWKISRAAVPTIMQKWQSLFGFMCLLNIQFIPGECLKTSVLSCALFKSWRKHDATGVFFFKNKVAECFLWLKHCCATKFQQILPWQCVKCPIWKPSKPWCVNCRHED